MYGVQKPSEYDPLDSFNYRQWFYRVYSHILSTVKVKTTTAAYTVENDIFYVRADATSGVITITLPTASVYPGRRIFIKKIDASGNAVTVSRGGTDTIEGSNTITLAAQWNSQELISNGNTMWEQL